ncbi:MAG: hypothetical protein WC044_00200 [Crocinitomicaceae bacterium]
MKTRFFIFTSMVCFIILAGCIKNKPSKGEYLALFHFIDSYYNDTIIQYRIVESNAKWIIFNSGSNHEQVDTLFKTSKTIVQGKMLTSTIVGNIARQKGSMKYMITGTFLHKHNSLDPWPYEFQGTFEIK